MRSQFAVVDCGEKAVAHPLMRHCNCFVRDCLSLIHTQAGRIARCAHRVEKKEGYASGDQVEANYQGGGDWYPATVTAVLDDGNLDISYDDDDGDNNELNIA